MDEQKYLYSIKPRRTIKNLNKEVPVIRTAKSLYLTKEEVAECLKHASVYRRFGVNQSVQVCGIDIDRLHNEKFYSKEEWDKIKNNKSVVNEKKKEDKIVAAVDAKEANVGANITHGSVTPVESKEASKTCSEDSENVADVTDKSNSDVDQVEATKDEVKEEVDANDQNSNSEITTVETSDSVSKGEKPEEVKAEAESEVSSAQVQVDQDADKQKFQPNPNKINANFKKKKKH